MFDPVGSAALTMTVSGADRFSLPPLSRRPTWTRPDSRGNRDEQWDDNYVCVDRDRELGFACVSGITNASFAAGAAAPKTVRGCSDF